MIGRIESKMASENELCFEMGPKGLVCCFASNALLGPPGFMLYNFCLRDRVIEKYNIEPDTGIINKLLYPCSFFQMLVSLKEWDTEKRSSENSIVRA